MASISLHYHVCDQLSNKWLRCPPKSQPFVKLSVKIQKEDYEYFRLHLSIQSDIVSVNAITDTECQCCLAAGFKLVEKLRSSREDLIPVNM